MRQSQACIDLLKRFEGYRDTAYKCPAGVWTIGYGHTKNVHEGDTCTPEMAETWLMEDTQEAADCILGNLSCALTQNEFDALVCFTYNVGCRNFKNSTMHLYLSNGQYLKASQEFQKWDHVDGSVVQGLLNRRLAEKALFLGVDSIARA